jgi:hypothetical protein
MSDQNKTTEPPKKKGWYEFEFLNYLGEWGPPIHCNVYSIERGFVMFKSLNGSVTSVNFSRGTIRRTMEPTNEIV